MSAPAADSFTIFQGSDFAREYRWLSSGVPVNLTGYTARMQFRNDIRDPLPVWDLTTANGGLQIVEPTDGRIRVVITADQSRAIQRQRMVFGIEVYAPGGAKTRLVEGSCQLSLPMVR